MALVKVVLACLVALVLSSDPRRLRPHTLAEREFTDWMIMYQKEYVTNEEYDMRYQNFLASVSRITLRNQRSSNVTYALNKFSDLTPAEFKLKYLMKTPLPKAAANVEVLKHASAVAPPTTFDWRSQNVVTPVKDQGQCGSCWAFSVTENIESVWMLAKGKKVADMSPLAPQQIVDCDHDDDGCNGGYPATAYGYVQSAGGLEPETAYPYRARDQTCSFKQAAVYASISNFKYATTEGDEATLKQNLVSTSPLSICLDASNWQDYSSGVMSGWDCCWFCELDHCVQLVGYDSTASTPYYIVRNSWGTDWGINGYIWLQMGDNTCGLTDYATTAIVS